MAFLRFGDRVGFDEDEFYVVDVRDDAGDYRTRDPRLNDLPDAVAKVALRS